MAIRATFLIAIAAVLFQGTVRADDSLKFLGSHETTTDALKESNAIFVGIITKDGVRQDGYFNLFVLDISNLEVMVLENLRGSSSGLLALSMTVPHKEVPPKVGDTLIFFNKSLTTIKLLPATDHNVAKVKQLISN